MADSRLLEQIRLAATPIEQDRDIGAILDAIGTARIVLLGEASHGTQEFYDIRAEVTRALIERSGFDAVAVEADWPDTVQVSRYLMSSPDSGDNFAANAEQALSGFTRFPRWMWRNGSVLRFVQSLREHNARQERESKVGFFGLDLYSLRSSIDAVIRYLERTDPALALEARQRYACFDHLAENPQDYGYAVMSGRRESCETEVVRQLGDMLKESIRLLRHDDPANPCAADELFYAQQNARVAANAELYYRTMFSRGYASWNVRDSHMADTLQALCRHIEDRKSRPAKIVVWAHNSHLGDARATEPSEQGELNLGQLAREHFGDAACYLLGFTTHAGTVTAASDWDAPAERKAVRPSLPGSVERLFHDTGVERFFLSLRDRPELAAPLAEPSLERAIGVVYRPETERMSHYFHVRLSRQFDGVVHIDRSSALDPLDRTAEWSAEEMPDTYPSGI